MRIRVSTVLLIIGMALSPIALFGVPPLYLPEKDGLLRNAFLWLQYDVPVALFAICFIVALCTGALLAFRKNWKGCLQCLLEMVACFVGFIFAPAY